jgi:hypothetical protein
MENINSFKRVILFLNASSFRMASIGTDKDSFYSNKNMSFGALLNCVLIFSLLRLLLGHSNNVSYLLLLLCPFVLQIVINVIFSSDLKLIANNYSVYYNQYFYKGYCLIIICAALYMLYYLFGWPF